MTEQPGEDAAAIAVAIVSSEAFMWLMAGANHQEIHLETLRPAFEAYKAVGGSTYGHIGGYAQEGETDAH